MKKYGIGREKRRTDAKKRQIVYDALTIDEKIDKAIHCKMGGSERELSKLQKIKMK